MQESGDLETIQNLYERGLYLQAYQRARERGPLTEWRGPRERVLAGRLAHNLGGRRTGTAIHLQAGREHPDDPEVRYFHARAILDHWGPLKAWRFLQRAESAQPDAGDETPCVLRADGASLRAHILGSLRDFDAADRYMEQALEIAPRHPWAHVEKAFLLQLEDRYEEALEVARKPLEWHPWFRPTVAITAHLLHLSGRDVEARSLLEEAACHLESGHVLLQLGDIQQEMGDFEAARATLERVTEHWPLMDEKISHWIQGRLSDALYLQGDIEGAARLAKEAGDPFHQSIHENLTADRPDRRRVLHDVEFVRQHHVTCAPATLTALSRFWSMPVDHLEVAEEICYDGTPHASERRWAIEHGWVAREFRLTWESAVALLDRGVPFTLTTVEPSSAHLQAVVGYDGFRGVLLIRDPYLRGIREFLADALMERYRAVGPRAMALVPAERAELLEGIELPDAPLYDLGYQVESALRRHDRDAADRCCLEMEALDAGHRLTQEARLSLAAYDANPLAELQCLEKLVEKYPESDHWRLLRGYRLTRLGRRGEYLDMLAEAAGTPGKDPVVLEQYAQALQEDARQVPEALRLTARSIHMLPERAPAYYIRGNLLWDQREFEDALEVYRFACCLDDKNEQFAWAYFSASRYFKRVDEALDFLVRRFQRFYHKSCGPIRTLFHALMALDRTQEAFDRMEQALLLRPDDGELILFAAEAYARYGRYEESEGLLEKSRGKCPATHWLRIVALLRYYRGELQESLGLWRQVLETEPLAMDAHRAVVARLIETEGREAALAHLRQSVERFGYHRELQELLVECLGADDPEATESAVRRLLEVDPVNAWAHRHLAILLVRQQRCDEAFLEVERSGELDPHNPGYRNVRGLVLRHSGRIEEAREEFRRAIRLTVDNDYAIRQLLDLAESPAERREALELVKEELARQVMFGSGILEYGEQAAGTLAPEEVLAVLEEALEARPDLWQAHAAVARQLAGMGRLGEAHALALEATRKFPLVPEIWLDLALVCRLEPDHDGEIRALEQARAIRRSWAVPVRLLADIHDREGRFEECRRLMEQAAAQEPADPINHGYVADALWKLGEKEAAIERLERAILLDPDHEWAWGRLQEWAEEAGRPDLPETMARHLTERRSGDATAWTVLATMLAGDKPAEALEALDRALLLDPRSFPAHDLRVEILSGLGRYEEALDACRPAVWGDRPPVPLQGRRAWVEAARGRIDKAIGLMEEILKFDESYVWGWSTLAEWYDARGDVDGLFRCAEQMVKLQPNSVTALALLGHALDGKKDHKGARAALTRAVLLAPDYPYGVYHLLQLLFSEGDLIEVERVLNRSMPHMPVADQMAHQVRLLSRRGRIDEALDVFRRLLRTGDIDDTSFELATADLEAGASDRMHDELALAVETGDARPHAAVFRVQYLTSGREWRQALRVLETLRDPEAWQAAASLCLRCAGEAMHRREVEWILERYGSRLATDTRGWAAAGYALNCTGLHDRCVKWLEDWRRREDVSPWMIENLAHSLRCIGQEAEAVGISEQALTMPPDLSRSMHEVWLLLDAVLGGRTAEARERLQRIDRRPLQKVHLYLLALSEAGLLLSNGEGKARMARQARRLVDGALKSHPWIYKDRFLRRLARRFVLRIARSCGGPSSWLWALRRLMTL